MTELRKMTVFVSLLLALLWNASIAFAQGNEPCTSEEPVMREGSGSVRTPYKIETLCQLQGISSNLTAHYELIADIDARPTHSWNEDAGFIPIAFGTEDGFSGSLVNSSNYVINNLTINHPSTNSGPVGLFSRLATGATIRNVILMDSRTTGYNIVGALAGENRGTIKKSSVSASVSGKNMVGGLVGSNYGDIRNSHVAASVSGDNTVGGLVGNSKGNISNSYATASVSGKNMIGGLVGNSKGDISNSYATASVSGGNTVGGLVGDSEGSISNSYATASVSGGNTVGGLVGESEGSISISYATGSVSGGNTVGGLVGDSHGIISHSHAAASVSGDNLVGGLVGDNDDDISHSYATGSVSGDNLVGGLVGINHVNISNSYATGSVSGDNLVGGLAGYNDGDISNSYTTASVWGNAEVGSLVGKGAVFFSEITNSYYYRGPDNGLGTKRTDEQLRCPTQQRAACPGGSTAIYKGWSTGVWDFGTVTELPQLLRNRNPDLNLKPYIAGPVERIVAADAVRITEVLDFEVDYAGPNGHANLTWTLASEEPGELGDLVYFVLPDSNTGRKEVRGVAKVQLLVTLNEGKNFQLVVTNDVSVNDDRVRVQILPALPPTVEGGDTQTRTVWEEAGSATLTFKVSDQGTSNIKDLTWKIVSSEIEENPGASATLVGSGTGAVAMMFVTRPPGLQDLGELTLEVRNSLNLAHTVTIRVRTRPCRGGGKDLETGQGGAGTPADPNQIWTLCQLQDISSAPNAHYELADGIDASPSRNWNEGKGFEPIASDTNPGGGFSGSFVNSSTHVITGLTINRPLTNNVALFARLAKGATVKGVILMDSRTIGRNNVGSLVGSGFGIIEGNHAAGRVWGNRNVGGLAGINGDAGRISRNSAAGTVSGYMNIGGLVGSNVEGEITYSYATGTVSGNRHIGGLVGRSDSEMDINNNYATGTVSGNEYIGGLVGYNNFRDVLNSYATGAVSGNEYTGGLVGYNHAGNTNDSYYARGRNNGLGEQRTLAQMRCQTRRETICPQDRTVTYEHWDRDVWDFGNSTDLPQLLFNPNPDLNLKPYIAGPVEQIVWIGAVPDTTALDFMAAYSGSDGAAPLTWTLAELSDEWAGFVRFDLAGGDRTGTTASGATARLLVEHGTERTLGESFQVVVRNHVTANDDRVWVRLMAALPPVIGGNSNLTRTVWEGAGSDLLVFTASDPRSGEETLTWHLDSSGIAQGNNAVLVGSPTGTITTVHVTFSPGIVDLGSFTLRVRNSLGIASSVTVNVETMPCRGGGDDLMAGQNGRGTINRPYRIETLCQLQDTNSNLAAHYALVASIDARPTSAWNDGAGFEPIAFNTATGFSASFVNSGNYVITGLTINRLNVNSNPVGLFSRLTRTAEIRGVILENSRMAGHNKVGSLAGENSGTIEHCSAAGSVSGSEEIGGLVGNNISSGNIGKSYATGTVSGALEVSGLVGTNSGHIRDSYAAGTVTGTRSAVGGLVGENTGHIIRSYAASTVTEMTSEVQDVGGLVGSSNGLIDDSYYYQKPPNNLGERRTFAQMVCPTMGSATCGTEKGDPSAMTYLGWKTDIWDFRGDSDLPKLQSYTAARLDQWLRMRVHLGGAAR